jgi:hypothetical protein
MNERIKDRCVGKVRRAGRRLKFGQNNHNDLISYVNILAERVEFLLPLFAILAADRRPATCGKIGAPAPTVAVHQTIASWLSFSTILGYG